jgi:hypothetical protein
MSSEGVRWTLVYQVQSNGFGGTEEKKVLINAMNRKDAGREALVKLHELQQKAGFYEYKKPTNPRLESSEPLILATMK